LAMLRRMVFFSARYRIVYSCHKNTTPFIPMVERLTERPPVNHLERFLAVMEYQQVDREPNWELGAWSQTRVRWDEETNETACP